MKYYDDWESQSAEARRRIVSRKLGEYVRYAQKEIPFYRDRLEAYDPKSEHPLSKVPVLNQADLRELLPPKRAGGGLVARGARNYTVFQSGGTTGYPKTTLFSHEEMEGLYLPNARGFHAVGLSREDRVANLFAVGGLYMTFLHVHRMLEAYGCMNFPFSNHTPVDFMHSVVKLFNVNCVAGIASMARSALLGFERLGLSGIRIEKIFYGGEHLYEADKKELREKFGAKVIAAPGYGTVDSWYLGYQCLACPTGVFHAHDDQAYIEIVDEETGRHCRPGERGMVYVTAFPRRLTPIVRYRVGDLARWGAELCPCGRTTPLFELLGRGDDVLRIGFDSVDYASILDCAGRVPGLSATLQMEKKREKGRDRLVVRVETELSQARRASAAKALEREILAQRLTLRKALDEDMVWPVQVELAPSRTLGRNPRTGKLIRVIDGTR
ncbi:MAG: hypothetical protein HY921_08250 [Elusimicrobia bacterium]|nr:hypothetical protein [Elusimicrobiota bacterium]